MTCALIAIADPLRSAGFEAFLQSTDASVECVLVATKTELARKLAKSTHWALAAIDLDLDETGVYDIITSTAKRCPGAHVLVLDSRPGTDRAYRALRSGARGVLTHRMTSAEIREAILRVSSGRRYIPGEVAAALVERIGANDEAPRHTQLTNRELEVLSLFGRGKRLVDIAQALSISVKTASTYRTKLLVKLDVANTAGLVRYAIEHRLAGPG